MDSEKEEQEVTCMPQSARARPQTRGLVPQGG